jgi:histidine triad (HIT) family protein
MFAAAKRNCPFSSRTSRARQGKNRSAPHHPTTLFQKIVAREIPARIISEDQDLIVFHDINPQAPVHVLLVPKQPITRLSEATAEDGAIFGKLLLKAQETAKALGISETGFRVVINSGRNGGETVPHLHVHLLGGRPLTWPPG